MKRAFYTLSTLHVFNDGYATSLVLLLPFITRDLHLTLTQVGILGALVHAMSVVFALPSGFFALKFGGFRVLTISVLIYSLGILGTSFGNSFLYLVSMFTLAGLGFSMFPSISLALIAQIANKENRGRTLGNFTAIGDLGKVGISTLATTMVVFIGWRLVSVWLGIFGGILFFYLLVTYFFKDRSLSLKEKGKVHIGEIFHVLRNKQFALTTTASAIDTLASSQLYIFIPFFLTSKGISLLQIGMYMGIYFAGNVLGKVLLGRMVDAYGNVKVFVSFEILMAIMIAIMFFANNYIVLLVLTFLLGAVAKGTVSPIQAMLVESIEDKHTIEVGTSVYSFIRNMMKVIAPFLLGLVSDKIGINQAFLLSAVLALVAITPALGYRKN